MVSLKWNWKFTPGEAHLAIESSLRLLLGRLEVDVVLLVLESTWSKSLVHPHKGPGHLDLHHFTNHPMPKLQLHQVQPLMPPS